MFYLSPEGKRHTLGTPFSYNGINYTRAGATHENFIALGFTQVIVGPRPDDRYYIVSGPKNDGTYDATPRDLDELKKAAIAEARTAAGSLLSQTDWMVVRQQEIGHQVPGDVAAYRQAVRDECNSYEQLINEVTKLDDLIGMQPQWPDLSLQLA